jgi:hypothetical protein
VRNLVARNPGKLRRVVSSDLEQPDVINISKLKKAEG